MKMKKRVAEYRAWRAEHEYDQDFSECPKVAYSDLSPCPKCGKTENIFMCDPLINSVYANFFLSCGNCGYEGPLGESERDAFAAWGVIFGSEKDEEGLNSKYAGHGG